MDEGLNVIEVVDESTGKTMASAWLYLATDGSLVIQNLEINAEYEKIKPLMDRLGRGMIDYAHSFADFIEAPRLLIGIPSHGKFFGKDSFIFTEYPRVAYGLEKMGGYLGEKYYLDSTGKPEAFLVTQVSSGASFGHVPPHNIAVLNNLIKPVHVWLDYKDIGNLSRPQIDEIYKRAMQNPKQLRVIVYSSLSTDKHPLLDLSNVIFSTKNAIESVSLVPKLENNIHLSRQIDPPAEFETIVKDQFRYQNEENGLFGVALLYTQSENKEKFLEWYGLKKVGKLFSMVSEAILKLVRENEGHLKLSRAA